MKQFKSKKNGNQCPGIKLQNVQVGFFTNKKRCDFLKLLAIGPACFKKPIS